MHCKRCGQQTAKDSEYCFDCLIRRERFLSVEILGLILGVVSLLTWYWPIIGLPVSIYGLCQSMSGKLNHKRFAMLALNMCYVGTAANLVVMLVPGWMGIRFSG